MPERQQHHLFVAGCPRSGTSALAFLLNEHPRVALGFERYKRVRAQLDPFHFTPAQFFAPVLAETDIRGELLYARLRARWESGAVRAMGDKVPLYTRVLPQLLARFPAGASGGAGARSAGRGDVVHAARGGPRGLVAG